MFDVCPPEPHFHVFARVLVTNGKATVEIKLKAGLNVRRKHKHHAPIGRFSSLLIILIPISIPYGKYLKILTMLASYCVIPKPYLLGKHLSRKIYQELRMPGKFVHCTHQPRPQGCKLTIISLENRGSGKPRMSHSFPKYQFYRNFLGPKVALGSITSR